MKKPLISIITPAYNRLTYLREALQSGQNQTFRNFEHIVIDDCSTDDVTSVIGGFKNPTIRVIRNTVNMGMGKSYNVGLREARGEYVAFLESDDIWAPNYLESQMQVLKNNPLAGAVYCGKFIIDGNSTMVGEEPSEGYADVFKACLLTPRIVPTILMAKTGTVREIGGFDEDMPKGTDWDFSLRLARAVRVVQNLATVAQYRVHPGQQTKEFFIDHRKAAWVYEYLYNKFRADYRAASHIGTDFLRNIGTTYCLAGDMGVGRHYFFAAIALCPRRFKNYRSALLSYVPVSFYRKLYAMNKKFHA